jgi:hypothetical protein
MLLPGSYNYVLNSLVLGFGADNPHITGIIEHYDLIEMAAGRGVIFHSNALDLRRAYSEFRPVHGDGECFYMSFIFSYLASVLSFP